MRTALRPLMIATAVLATGAFAQSEIQKHLSATIVDEVDFRQFTLPQALQSLSNAVAAEAWVPVSIDPEADISDRTVTFSARRIRLSLALKIIAEVTDFWVQYHEDKVVFSSKCCPVASGLENKDTCPHLVKQQYQSRRLVDALISAREVPDWRCRSTPEDQTMDEWFKDWVSDLGVKWHSGSSIAIDTNRSIITVINAPSEIDVFESIFYDDDATNWPKIKDIRLEAQQHLRQVSSEAAPSASPGEPSRRASAGHMKSTTMSALLTVTVLCTGCCAAKDPVKADSTPSDVPFLIEQTHSENADTRGRAAFALEKIGTEASQAIPVLTALLQDKDEHVRAAAASALRVFGANAKGAVSPLIGNLNDPYFGARSCAAAALGTIGPDAKDAVPHLMEMLQNDKGEPLRNALWALGEIGPDSLLAVPSIIRMLEQGERELRIMAIDTLGKIRPSEEDVIRKLAGRITPKDTEMNRHIVSALEHIGAPAVQDLMKLVTHENAELRVLAIRSLGEVGPDAKGAIPVLAEALNDHQVAGPMLASATAPRTVGDWARIALKRIEQKERPSNQSQKATGKPAP